jgi:hypothetical protein
MLTHRSLFFCLAVTLAATSTTPAHAEEARKFRVWAVSCSHVPADIRRERESLAKAIRQSEGREEGAPAFDWDVMVDAGDLSAHQTPPATPTAASWSASTAP